MRIAVGGTSGFLCVCGVVFYEALYTNTTEYGVMDAVVLCRYDG